MVRATSDSWQTINGGLEQPTWIIKPQQVATPVVALLSTLADNKHIGVCFKHKLWCKHKYMLTNVDLSLDLCLYLNRIVPT